MISDEQFLECTRELWRGYLDGKLKKLMGDEEAMGYYERLKGLGVVDGVVFDLVTKGKVAEDKVEEELDLRGFRDILKARLSSLVSRSEYRKGMEMAIGLLEEYMKGKIYVNG